MSVELEIGWGMANLKLNLGEFVAVVQQIAGITQEREAREALKEAIAEIRKSCDTAVDVFTPLYALTTEATFAQQFGALHAAFKNAYLKNPDAGRTHCSIVERHLGALLQKKAWMSGLPLLDRSYTRLNELCGRWLFSDYTLADQMSSHLQHVDKFYDEVSAMAAGDQAAGFEMLRSSLAQFEDDFLSLRKQLGALTVLSGTL